MSELCQCGCGGLAPISAYTNRRLGYLKGKARRFISGHNSRGAGNPNWREGRSTNGDGYVRIRTGPNSWEYEHRLIMASRIGRPLRKGEVVHHIDGDPGNNDPKNLLLLSGQAEHVRLERTGKPLSTEHRARISEGLKRSWKRRKSA